MSEGFDYQAWQRQQQGGHNPDDSLLVTFWWEAEEKPDGSFENVEWIKIWKDRYTEIARKATPEDRERFASRYKSFIKGEKTPDDGTPISKCPLAMPSNVAACRAENIHTIEQLVETPDTRLQRGGLVEFKYLMRDWLESRSKDHYIKEFRQRMDALEKENIMLKEKFQEAGIEVPDVTPAPPKKKRGRPRKVKA